VEELRRRRGLTIILVTHDAGIAARADRIVRMLDGKIVGEEAPASQPAAPAAVDSADGA
jgi:macrolide transport system ATP-binding/permease protein